MIFQILSYSLITSLGPIHFMGSKPSAVSWALSLESCTRRNRGRVEEITKMAGTERKKRKVSLKGG